MQFCIVKAEIAQELWRLVDGMKGERFVSGEHSPSRNATGSGTDIETPAGSSQPSEDHLRLISGGSNMNEGSRIADSTG